MVSEAVHRAGYDLSSWQGIAKVLADARAKLQGAEYHSFYDLVTAYSRGRGTDSAQRAEIEKVLSRWGASVEAGTLPVHTPVKVAEVAPEEKKTTAGTHPEVPEEDADADAVLAAALRESTPETSSQAAKEETEAVPQESPRTDVVPHIVSEEKTAAPEHLVTLDEARARIAEIKHEVHELVGNPVVLVGELGSIGKTYMQSLLKATRATMGGSSGALMPSMRELESVYEQLRIAALTGPEEAATEKVAPSAVPEKVAEEEVVPEPEVAHSEVGIESLSVPVEEKSEPASPDILEEEVVEPPVAEQSVEKDAQEPEQVPEIPQTPVQTTEKEPVRPVSSLRVATRPRPQFRTPTREVAVPRREPAESAHDDELDALRARLNALEHTLEDVQKKPDTADAMHHGAVGEYQDTAAKEKEEVAVVIQPEPTPVPKHREEESREEKRVAPEKAPVAKKPDVPAPLHTLQPTFTAVQKNRELEYQAEKVSEGVRSLLLSWDIFRGGLLSGKARGADHPLYIETREKTMSDVLSGKFAGAKTHVVISINDYVNAWRFEQGIEYSPAETFEHYLRRVVHRILVRTGGN